MEPELSCTAWTPEYFIAHESACQAKLADATVWASIPLLNCTELAALPDGSIVRFRGMLQDMQDPEYYLERYCVRGKADGSIVRQQNGKYRDILVYNAATETVDMADSVNSTLGERRSMFVATFPGQNRWAQECERVLHVGVLPATGSEQRCLLDEGDPPARGSGVKRPPEDDGSVMEADGTQQRDTTDRTEGGVGGGVKKRPASNKIVESASASTGGTGGLSAEYLLNAPIAERPGKVCLVKVYGNYDDWMINTIVEVVGFLSVDPALDGTGDCGTDMDEFTDDVSERQATHPPPSLIPRLHAVCVRKLPHTNPLVVPLGVVDDESPEDDPVTMAAMYTQLHNLLTKCLFGDAIGAEYLLCHLVSSVYIRNDTESRGQFCLNLSNIPALATDAYTRQLYDVLEELLPASHYLPMTLENINTTQFVPKKDYVTNKLTSGLLQLAPHTHLVLDETRMQQGKIEAHGVEALRQVSDLIRFQRLKYQFNFYQLDFLANVPVLVLSEGRSMLPSDCFLPIIPDPDELECIVETINEARRSIGPMLEAIRCYLTAARIRHFDMSTLDPTVVQEDFLQLRRDNPAAKAEDLHALLVVARLVALSRGKRSLTRDDWERAKVLEKEKRHRQEFFGKLNLRQRV